MSVIIRLQNLPWSANSFDIRQYFQGLSIPEGGVHIIGGELGDAFIAFSTDEDARQAMLLNGGKLKEVQISLMLSSRAEMYKVVEQARSATYPAPQQQPSMAPAAQQPMMIHNQLNNDPSPSPPRILQQQETMQQSKQPSSQMDRKDALENDDRKKKRGGIRSRSRSRSRSRDRSRNVMRRDRRRRSRSRSRDRRHRRSRSRSRGRDRYGRDIERRDEFKKSKSGDDEPNEPMESSSKPPLIDLRDRPTPRNDDKSRGSQMSQDIPMRSGNNMMGSEISPGGMGMLHSGVTMGMMQMSGMPQLGSLGMQSMGGMSLGGPMSMPPMGMGMSQGGGVRVPPGDFSMMQGGMGIPPGGINPPQQGMGIPHMKMPGMGIIQPSENLANPKNSVLNDEKFSAAIRNTLRAFNIPEPNANIPVFGGRDHERSPPFQGRESEPKTRHSRFSDNVEEKDRRSNPNDMARNQPSRDFTSFGTNNATMPPYGPMSGLNAPFGPTPPFNMPPESNSRSNSQRMSAPQFGANGGRIADGDERNYRRDFDESSNRNDDTFKSRFLSGTDRSYDSGSKRDFNSHDRSQNRSFDERKQGDQYGKSYNHSNDFNRQQPQNNRNSDSGRHSRDKKSYDDSHQRYSKDERRDRDDQNRPVYERDPGRYDEKVDQDNRSRSVENNPKDASCGLCVELRNCPSVGYKEIRRAFSVFGCVINEIVFSNESSDKRRIAIQFKFWNNKMAALKMSNKVLIIGQPVNVCHLPDEEFTKLLEERQALLDASELRAAHNTQFCVKILGVPDSFTSKDLENIFPKVNILKHYVKNVPGIGSVAYVQFGKETDVAKVLSSKEASRYKIEKISNEDFIPPPEAPPVEKSLVPDQLIPMNSSQKIDISNQPITTCVKLTNLPFGSIDRDICDFFSDIGLVPIAIHIMLNNEGSPSGEGYVEFPVPQMASQACSKDGAPLGPQNVSVQMVPREVMIEALEGPENDFSNTNRPPPLMQPNSGPPPECVVTLENVPFRAETDDILQFFGRRFNISPQNVFRKLNHAGQNTGNARVIMSNPEDAMLAVTTLNRKNIWDRPVRLRLLSECF